jgi:hypothetical protein
LGAISGFTMHGEGEFFVAVDQAAGQAGAALIALDANGFYGDPASLQLSAEELGSASNATEWARQNPQAYADRALQPAVVLPAKHFGSAIGDPVFLDGDASTASALVGNVEAPRLLKLSLEKIDDRWQGAAWVFLDTPKLGGGNQRFAYDREAQHLYIAQGSPGRGLQRLDLSEPRASGFTIRQVSLAHDGFEFVFSQRIDRTLASDPNQWQVRHAPWPAAATAAAGAGAGAATPATPRHIIITPDGRGVTLQFETLKAGQVYEFSLDKLVSESGQRLDHAFVAYTLNRLRASAPVDPNPPSVPHAEPAPAPAPEVMPDSKPKPKPKAKPVDEFPDPAPTPEAAP